MKTDLNVAPYYDDFDKTKNFQNILFRPGFAVQARELSQIQSIIQNKIGHLGDFAFQDGTMVVPGQLSLLRNYTGIRIQTTFNGESVDLSKYVNETTPVTITGATSGIKAKIHGHQRIKNKKANTRGSAPKLDGNIMSGDSALKATTSGSFQDLQFIAGEDLIADIDIQHTTGGATIPAGTASLKCEELTQLPPGRTSPSNSQVAALMEAGVYYIRGHFVEVPRTIKILSNEQFLWSGRVGLFIEEEVITPESDPTLTDNSTGSSNYAATGSHRLKIKATLTRRPSTPTAEFDKDFLQLMKVESNQIVAKQDETVIGTLSHTLAQRTADESGNYTVKPFTFEINESVTVNKNIGFYSRGDTTSDGAAAADSLLALKVSPGKAYVNGYQIELISPIVKDIPKARDYNTVNAGISTFQIGNYALVTKIYGSPDIDYVSGELAAYKTCELYDTLTATRGSASGTLIGAARVRAMEYYSGTAGASSTNITSKYKMYLFDIRPFTKLTLSGTPSATLIANGSSGGIQIKGVTSGATGWVYASGTSSTNVNLTNVSGSFSSGENITASDRSGNVATSAPADITISSVAVHTFADVKQMYMQDLGATSNHDFTCDIDLGATKTLSGTYTSAATAGAASLTGVSGYDTSEVKVGDVLTIATGSAGATEDRVVDALTATTISFTAAPSTVNTGSVIRKRAKLYDTEKNLSLVKLPKNTIKTHLTATNSGASDTQYTLRKQYVVSSNASGVLSISAGTNETFVAQSDIDYTVSILTAGDGTGVHGDVVTTTAKVSGVGTATLTITDDTIFGSGAKCKVIATVLKSSVSAKAKTTKLMKQLKVEQEAVTDPYGTRPTDKTISLGRADAFKLVAVLDSETTADAVAPTMSVGAITGVFIRGEKITGSTTNATGRIIDISSPISYILTSGAKDFAVGDTITGEKSGATAVISALTLSSSNITNRYLLDTGQRDNYYDIARIERRPGMAAPTGELLIIYDYLEHGAGAFFTVDSFTDIANQMTYEDIPTYTSTKVDPDLPSPSGEFPLYNVYDFRPRVEDITGTSTNLETVDEISSFSFDIFHRQFDGTGASLTNWPKPTSTVQSDFEYYLPRMDFLHMNSTGRIVHTQGISAEVPRLPKEPANCMKLCSLALPSYVFSPKDVGITREKNQRFTMKDIGKLQDRVENIEYYTSMSLLERNAESFEITDANGLNRFKSGFIVDNFAGHRVGDTQHPDYKISMDGTNNWMRPTFTAKGVELEEAATTDVARTGAHYQKTGDLITLPYREFMYMENHAASRIERIAPMITQQWLGHIVLDPATDTWFETEVAPQLVINVEGNFNTLLQENEHALGTIWNAWQTQWSGVVDSDTTTNSIDDGQGTITSTARTVQTIRSDLRRTGLNTQVLERIDRQSKGTKIIQQAMIPFCRERTISFTGQGFFPHTRLYAFFDAKTASIYCQPAQGFSDGEVTVPAVGSQIVTDAVGAVQGTFTIPDPKIEGNPKFTAGEVVFRLTSSINNKKSTRPVTAGETTYTAMGTLNTEQETIVATRNADVVRTGTQQTSSVMSENSFSNVTQEFYDPPRPPAQDIPAGSDWISSETDADANDDSDGNDDGCSGCGGCGGCGCEGCGCGGDPMAQTFMTFNAITNNQNADGQPLADNLATTRGQRENEEVGQFVTSVELFFAEKDPVVPVRVEIRDVANGYPAAKILPFGSTTVAAADLNLSNDGTVATKWTFPAPVFLKTNKMYCFVIIGESLMHKVWVSRVGEEDISGVGHISEQPHMGTMFVSHNNTTWEASMMEDVKFRLYTARFDNTKAGTLTLTNKGLPAKKLKMNPLQFTNGSTTLKVFHRDHHMYSTTNNVTIAGAVSGAATTLSGALTSSATSLTLASGALFDDTTGRYRYDVSSFWWIKIDDEIMKYTTISGTAVSVITRAQGGTVAASHSDGAIVELYSLHGTPLTEVNKTFNVIANIGIDSYTVLLSSAPTVGGAGVADNGGSDVTCTENALFNTSEFNLDILELDNTKVTPKMMTTTGTSPSGTETSFTKTGSTDAQTVQIGDNHSHDTTQLVASTINETLQLGGSKSLEFPVSLTSTKANLSPIIDLGRMNFVAVANRMNDIDSSTDVYPTSEWTGMQAPDGDENAAVYMTKRVTLENPATALKIVFGAYRHSSAEIKVLYKTLRTDDASNFDDLGWTFFNSTGDPDVSTPASLSASNFLEYKYTAGVTDDGIGTPLDEFIQFAIKIVLQGTNSSEVPRLKDFRAIALAT